MADSTNLAADGAMHPGGDREVVPELLHRFKNHLQVIIGLLTVQATAIQDPHHIEAIRTTQRRIRAIAAVYAPLGAGKNISTVHLGECLRNLAQNVTADFATSPWVQLQESFADMALDIERALPLALVANELLSNAFGHAFPDGRAGGISIELRYLGNAQEVQGWGELCVSDNGVGCSSKLDLATVDSPGLLICRGLVRQIRGMMGFETGTGTRFRVAFPLSNDSREL